MLGFYNLPSFLVISFFGSLQTNTKYSNIIFWKTDKNAYTLSWEDRMRIAVDAAQGLREENNPWYAL